MRASVIVLAALCLVATALAQMEMGMMGMGGAPSKIIDVAPVFSADGNSIMFSRVHASLTGNEWVASSVQGGMGGMMGGEMGMMGGMPGGMPGMGGMGAPPDLTKEGIFQIPAKGGEEKAVVGGRAILQDAASGQLCYLFQGSGAMSYNQWGIYGMKFGGGDNDRWYPGYPVLAAWVRLSPKGDLFAIPYDQAKAVVFFPAQANTQTNAGYCALEDRKLPINWLTSGDGIWVVQQETKQQQGGGGMMPGGMPGGMMMGPEMGMMGGFGVSTLYHLAKGMTNQQVTPVIKEVGKDSMAASVPGGTDIVASIGKTQATMGGPEPLQGIFLFDQAGAAKRKLASDQAVALEVSPDGKYAAYLWGAKAPYTLSVAPLDGRPIRRVGFNLSGIVSGCKPFSWSADSRKLAFGAEDEVGYGVFVVDIETGERSRITTASTKDTGTAAPAGAGG